jgi:hypothetical protein
MRALFVKSGVPMSRHVNYQFNLSEEQETWVLDMRSRCTKALEKQSLDARNFLKTFQHVAAHERKWTKWKLESCPNVEKSSIDIAEGVVKKKLEVIIIFNLWSLWLLKRVGLEMKKCHGCGKRGEMSRGF